jgi:hypothetical protein
MRIMRGMPLQPLGNGMSAMTGILVFIAVSVMFSCRAAFAQEEGLGLGIVFGEPTGISLKSFISETDAMDAAVAWSRDSLHLHADYLVHRYDVLHAGSDGLPIYFGIGCRLKFDEGDDDSDVQVGLRIPLGIAYWFKGTPIEVFAEIAPLMDLLPDTDAEFNAGIGIRYYLGVKRQKNSRSKPSGQSGGHGPGE